MKTYKPGQRRPHPMETQSIPENRRGTRRYWAYIRGCADPKRLRNLTPRAMARARNAIEARRAHTSRAARALYLAQLISEVEDLRY